MSRTKEKTMLFLKWGDCKSDDEKKPDVLDLMVVDAEPFETEYSTNAQVQVKRGSKYVDVILPLKSHESKNASLLNQWNRNSERGRLKPKTKFRLKTWLGKSKTTGRPIRRFVLVFS
jgi:hypothetical protein